MSVCVICQSSISGETGLDCCQHTFCFECIASWTKECTKCPLCQKKYTALLRTTNNSDGKTGSTKKMKVKEVDRREENWMEVMEELESEEEDSDDSENDCYEEDFVLPDGVCVYEDGLIVDERSENDEFVDKVSHKQKDCIIKCDNGEIIRIQWLNQQRQTHRPQILDNDSDNEYVPAEISYSSDEFLDEDEEDEESFESEEEDERQTYGRVIYNPKKRK